VSSARRFVERTLEEWALAAPGWAAVQLISELATNAIIHAATDFHVQISQDGSTLRICVLDASPTTPGVRRYGQESTTGRGLRLVESMSSRWGVETDGFGKTVWFELDLGEARTAHTWDDGEDVDLDALLEQLGADDLDVRDLTALAA
jgi:anti-sigma regulatory factor (Ser/Thr protein kinase)